MIYFTNVINCMIKLVNCLLFLNDKMIILRPKLIKPILYSCYKIMRTQSVKYHLLLSLEIQIVTYMISFFTQKIMVKTMANMTTQICTNKPNIKYILFKNILKFNIDLLLLFIYSVVSYVIYMKNNMNNQKNE
jgi:hypothetical protein